MPRAWIVSKKRDRRCRNVGMSCYGTCPAGSKFSLDGDTGKARFGCATCGHVHEWQISEYKERRACKGCNRVRNVTVGLYTDGTEHAAEFCDACDAMRSAAVHLRTAKRLAAKAFEIYERHEVDVPEWAPYRKVSP